MYGIFILGQTGTTLSYSGILVVIAVNMIKPFKALMKYMRPETASKISNQSNQQSLLSSVTQTCDSSKMGKSTLPFTQNTNHETQNEQNSLHICSKDAAEHNLHSFTSYNECSDADCSSLSSDEE